MNQADSPYLIAIMGPTGSGKTFLAERMAKELNAQLINADAFHIYKGFDIGTNKPHNKEVYKLLDIKEPHEPFSAGEWINETLPILQELWDQKKHAIIVGGTGFYIRALFEEWRDLEPAPPKEVRDKILNQEKQFGLKTLYDQLQELDPFTAKEIDPQNPIRVRRALEKALAPQPKITFQLPGFQKTKIGILLPVDRLNTLIDQRTKHLLEAGWIEETTYLKEQGITKDLPAMRAIGYQTVFELTENQILYPEALFKIQIETKQYAKKQRTWLRSEPHLKKLFIKDLEELEQISLTSIL